MLQCYIQYSHPSPGARHLVPPLQPAIYQTEYNLCLHLHNGQTVHWTRPLALKKQ